MFGVNIKIRFIQDYLLTEFVNASKNPHKL